MEYRLILNDRVEKVMPFFNPLLCFIAMHKERDINQ